VKFQATIAGRTLRIEVDHDRMVWVDGRPVYAVLQKWDGLPVYGLALDDAGYMVFIHKEQAGYRVEIRDRSFDVVVTPDRPTLASPQQQRGEAGCTAQAAVCAPLAGCLVALPAAVGERVEAEQVVAVVESMKMQMELRTPAAGVVQAVNGPPGRDVERDEELVVVCRSLT
jgi:biotin carboxyl carrier protein